MMYSKLKVLSTVLIALLLNSVVADTNSLIGVTYSRLGRLYRDEMIVTDIAVNSDVITNTVTSLQAEALTPVYSEITNVMTYVDKSIATNALQDLRIKQLRNEVSNHYAYIDYVVKLKYNAGVDLTPTNTVLIDTISYCTEPLSNEVERISSNVVYKLAGVEFDFKNGDNAVKTLYDNLTNVIIRLGGDVVNPIEFK